MINFPLAGFYSAFTVLPLVMPPSTGYGNNYWTPLFVLLGWLSLLGLLGFLAVVVYLLVRGKKRGSSIEGSEKIEETEVEKQDYVLRNLGLLVLHVISFFVSWVIWLSLSWGGIALYIATFFEPDFTVWHYLIPYILILLGIPFTALICLKTWSGIKTRKGVDRRPFVLYRKVYSLLQAFLSLVFMVISSIFVLAVFVLAFTSGGYSETFLIMGVPLIPGLISLFYLVWYVAEFLFIRKEVREK